MIEYLARCHCGVLTARYATAIETSAWSVRACQCSFCRCHGAITTSDPSGLLTFRCNEAASLQRYRFGARTADFFLCMECGVYVGAQMKSEKGRFGIVNVQTLRPLPGFATVPEPMDYETESGPMRRLRREAVWTPLSEESL